MRQETRTTEPRREGDQWRHAQLSKTFMFPKIIRLQKCQIKMEATVKIRQ